VPVVRAVGGLADTIFDRDHSDRPTNMRNGYVFHESDHCALESALARALGLWYDYPQQFRELAQNGMRHDYSWSRPGEDYIRIYEHIRHR
jgi:starch synthase